MKRQNYPTDLNDTQWELIKPYIPPGNPRGHPGRPAEHERRELINAMLYVNRTGCQWQMLPHDFPPHKTVHHYFNTWQKSGIWEELNDALRKEVRRQEGRHTEPTAGSIDSQSVKTTEVGGEKGYDAGKKIKGRKRHIVVDTLGLLLVVVVHAASIQDRDGAKLSLNKAFAKCPLLQLLWADGGYAGKLVEWVLSLFGKVLQIVKRSDAQKGFVLLPRRWVVERTFGWLGRYRRLSKDYERNPRNSEGMIYLAMTHVMVRRLA